MNTAQGPSRLFIAAWRFTPGDLIVGMSRLIRDGPLENLWGRGVGEVQKKYSRKEKLNEKNSCKPINPKKYSCYGLKKKIHTRNLIPKKNSCGSKISPSPPYNFSNGPSLMLREWGTKKRFCLVPSSKAVRGSPLKDWPATRRFSGRRWDPKEKRRNTWSQDLYFESQYINPSSVFS